MCSAPLAGQPGLKESELGKEKEAKDGERGLAASGEEGKASESQEQHNDKGGLQLLHSISREMPSGFVAASLPQNTDQHHYSMHARAWQRPDSAHTCLGD